MSRIDCDKFEDLLDSRLHGRLEGSDLTWYEEHRRGCEQCRQSEAIWGGVTSTMRSMKPEPLPPLVERSIAVSAADQKKSPPPRQRLTVPAFAAGFALAAAAAAALVLGGVFQGPPRTLEKDQTATVEDDAPSFDVVRLDDGRRVVRLDDVTNLWVDDQSMFRMDEVNPDSVRVFLEQGRVVADIGPHHGAFKFVVVTPFGEVEAKGTIFAVEVSDTGQSVTRVLRGLVEVRRVKDGYGDRAFLVGVGEKGTVGEVSATRTSRWETEGDFCLLRGCNGSPSSVDEQVAAAAVDSEQEAEPVPLDKEAPSRISTPRRPVESSPEGEAQKPSRPAPADDQVTSKVAEELVARALVLRKRGDYDGAADTYRELIKTSPGCAEASNALVSLGQLELVNLKNPGSAISHFQSYLTRAPGGILAEEARLGKVRAHAAMAVYPEVISAADDYLDAHPGGYAGAEVTLRRADAKRFLGNCEGAVKDYEQLKTWWPAASQIGSAEAGIRACRPGENP